MDNLYKVYILLSQSSGRYYVGYTNDIERRLSEHNRKKGKYTDAGQPWELAYSETFDSKSDAQKRERYIKSRKSKKYIQDLITGEES